MKNKTIYYDLPAWLIALFGVLTLFVGSSVIFDLFGMRQKEGNYVPLVVWINLVCGILYLAGAWFLFKKSKKAVLPLTIAMILLISGFAAFGWHINQGNLFETKTIYALLFRTTITLAFVTVTYFLTNTQKENYEITH